MAPSTVLVAFLALATAATAPRDSANSWLTPGAIIESETRPLDLDGNHRFEWLAVRTRVPLSHPGKWYAEGMVLIPTHEGALGDIVYEREWDWRRQSFPEPCFECDTLPCPIEVWISGRYLARAASDSAIVINLIVGQPTAWHRDWPRYTLYVRRSDWSRFEPGGKGWKRK